MRTVNQHKKPINTERVSDENVKDERVAYVKTIQAESAKAFHHEGDYLGTFVVHAYGKNVLGADGARLVSFAHFVTPTMHPFVALEANKSLNEAIKKVYTEKGTKWVI